MVGLNEGSNMNKNIMGYFKSIQTFIRSLFYKHEEQTKQNTCTLQQEKYLKIGANICNIGFKSKHAYEDWQEDIFNHISVGDLVYCTMPVTDKALKAIPEGHTTRPFLIVKKGRDELYGYACATHPKSLRSYEKHIFTNEVYDSQNSRYKDSVVQFDCAYVIPIAHIQYIYKELDEYCVRQIARELKAYANIRNKAILNFDMEIPIHKGDIFKINKSYYYFNDMKDNKYEMYKCINGDDLTDSKYFRFKNIPRSIDFSNTYTFEDLDINNLIEVSCTCRNDWVNKQLNKTKPKEKKKQYERKLTPGTIIFEEPWIIYLFDCDNTSYGINYNKFKNHICELVEFKLDIDKATHIVFTEQQCASIYKALIEQNDVHMEYLNKRLNSVENTTLLPYELEYPVGTILESRFDEIKYVYLYTYNKKKFGLKINSKNHKNKVVPINAKELDVVDQLRFECMKEELKIIQKTALDVVRNILRDIEKNLINHDLEHSISFSQKYPVGTVLSCTYNESEEYMYLYTINDIHYAIYLDDACEGVYIVEPIIIYDYKPNGELVDEDTKEILTGILETTQRLNTYNCTKALLEQLEAC